MTFSRRIISCACSTQIETHFHNKFFPFLSFVPLPGFRLSRIEILAEAHFVVVNGQMALLSHRSMECIQFHSEMSLKEWFIITNIIATLERWLIDSSQSCRFYCEQTKREREKKSNKNLFYKILSKCAQTS